MTPGPKGAGKMQRRLNKVRFESRLRKRQRPMPKEDDDPIIVAYSDEEEVDPIIIVAGLEGDEQKDQEGGHTREEESPQLPPEEEKGSLPYAYTPRSPPTPHLKTKLGKLKVCLSWLISMKTRHRDSTSQPKCRQGLFPGLRKTVSG